MQLQDAKVLITGGNSGIGLETARQLKAAGAKVVIAGRNAEQLAQRAQAEGFETVVADVSQEAQVIEMVSEAARRLGGLNVLVNNAGMGQIAPLVDIELSQFEKLLATNLTGAMLVAREVAKHLIAQGQGGTIINVGSVAGLRGVAGQTAYAASKFALRGMTQAWRSELRTHDIRVSYVAPSEVITDFSSKLGANRPKDPNKIQAEDIAGAICDLIAMNDRAFVTELEVWATNPDKG